MTVVEIETDEYMKFLRNSIFEHLNIIDACPQCEICFKAKQGDHTYIHINIELELQYAEQQQIWDQGQSQTVLYIDTLLLKDNYDTILSKTKTVCDRLFDSDCMVDVYDIIEEILTQLMEDNVTP